MGNNKKNSASALFFMGDFNLKIKEKSPHSHPPSGALA
jgi:hypothetical protein